MLRVAFGVAAACVFSFTLLAPSSACAESAAVEANRGFQLGIGPILLVPRSGGPLGGGLIVDGRYGIEAGPLIVGPGGRAAGYAISGRFIGTLMPTLRITLPVGPLAPFLLGGVGGGMLTNPSDQGVALLGGGGLMIHFGRVLAIGAEVTYQTITGTDFTNLAIGPAIAIGVP